MRLTTLPPSCAVIMKSGNLNFLEPSGPLQACNETALVAHKILQQQSFSTTELQDIYIYIYIYIYIKVHFPLHTRVCRSNCLLREYFPTETFALIDFRSLMMLVLVSACNVRYTHTHNGSLHRRQRLTGRPSL